MFEISNNMKWKLIDAEINAGQNMQEKAFFNSKG